MDQQPPLLPLGKPGHEPAAVPADNFTDKINAAAIEACEDGRCVTEGCKHNAFRQHVEKLVKASLEKDAESGFANYDEVTVHRCKQNGWFLREPRGNTAFVLLLVGVFVTTYVMIDTGSGIAMLLGTGLVWLIISAIVAFVALAVLTLCGALETKEEVKVYRTKSRQCYVRGEDAQRFAHTSHGQLVRYGLGDGAVHDRHDGWHFVNIDDIPANQRPQVIRDLQR